MKRFMVVLILVALANSGCGAAGSVSPTVAVTPTVTVTSTATITPTATITGETPTITATPPATATITATLNAGETPTVSPTLGAATITATLAVTPRLEVSTSWFTATNIVTSVVPVKGLLSDDKLMWSNVIRDPGVLGADKLAEADANESAVWTGGANHQIPDQRLVGAIVPEAGYLSAYASGMLVEVGDVTLELPNCGENCGWGIVVRGSNTEPVAVTIENLGAPGGLIYTRYPVPRHAGEFFSERYIQDQAENFLRFDNCGVDGCSVMYQAVYDINDDALTVLRYTAAGDWERIWTNVQ